MEAQNQVQLCQEVEQELRELCTECRKKLPSIKEYTERAILKIKHHRDVVEKAVAGASAGSGTTVTLPEFPLQEVLSSILMACETFQHKIVLISLSCLQRLIHRRVLKEPSIAIVINLMKEQATNANNDEQVQLKVLQTVMLTPSHITLASELVLEQVLQLLYVLHNSSSPGVHHTACAGLRQLAESLTDRAAHIAAGHGPASGSSAAVAALGGEEREQQLRRIGAVVQPAQPGSSALPTLSPTPAPTTLPEPMRLMYNFVQDLCVMADYDHSGLSSRYSADPGERMRTGLREGYWLTTIRFPRPLCLELLGACVAGHPEVFYTVPEFFALLRQSVCPVLLKNLRGCFDFAILIRSTHLLQQLLRSPQLAAMVITELQVFLHLMLDLTTAERSPWQRATSLEFLKSICEDSNILAVLHESGGSALCSSGPAAGVGSDGSPPAARTFFVELVDSLIKLMHQVCFSTGMDGGALLQSGPSRDLASASGAGGGSGAAGAAAGGATSSGGSGGGPGRGAVGGGSSGSRGSGSRGGSAAAAAAAAASGGTVAGSGAPLGRGVGTRLKLLLLMSETEPPAVQPSFLVALVVECVFAIVNTLHGLLLASNGEGGPGVAADGTAATESAAAGAAAEGPMVAGEASRPWRPPFSPAQARCKGMVTDCWASLLSALQLLLHGTVDEAHLHQVLRCLHTLLYCCSRLGLAQARDTCLLQVSRYALPGQTHEADVDSGPSSAVVPQGLSPKNVLCFRALLRFCYSFGTLLGVVGWGIALGAFDGLEKIIGKSTTVQAQDLAVLRRTLDSLFETTALLPEEALADIIAAVGDYVRTLPDGDDGCIFNRLVELCIFNLGRLLSVWGRVLQIVLEVCSAEHWVDLRSVAAGSLCRILSQALRKGALAMSAHPEAAQKELLLSLEALLHVPHEDARARVCEGLLAVLQASGQELQPAAWATMVRLVAVAARVELERAGLDFYLPQDLDSFSPDVAAEAAPTGEAAAAVDAAAAALAAAASLPQRQQSRFVARSSFGTDGREAPAVLPTVFALLELIVHDFMEYVPPDSVPHLTASIGAFARCTSLGVNSSLTAVGFLWNVADAIGALYRSPVAGGGGDAGAGGEAPPTLTTAAHGAASAPDGTSVVATEQAVAPSGPGPGGGTDELWIQIFNHLRVLAVDARPEVRNCAVKSLTSALLSHGRKVGTECYRRCLRDILIRVLGEVQEATRLARGQKQVVAEIIVHHSRDTLEKQWDETMVLGLESVRRVLTHFAEEAGAAAFAPLAYTLLLEVQKTMQALSVELSGAALRALVDLVRMPAAHQAFVVQATLSLSPELPVTSTTSTSVWLLGWTVLWQMVGFCMTRELPEQLVDAFASSLGILRGSHGHLLTPVQHLMLVEMVFVLTTAPALYLSQSQPFQLHDDGGTQASKRASPPPPPPPDTTGAAAGATAGGDDPQGHAVALGAALQSCSWDAEQRRSREPAAVHASGEQDKEVFDFALRSPQALWDLQRRTAHAEKQKGYVKASVPLRGLVEGNQSRNLEIKSLAAAAATPPQAELGPGQSPTHRTMLHICTAKLTPAQSSIFTLLEETQGYSEPFLEVCFLCQLCAVFLDVRQVLTDTTRVAFASRTLCLLINFCRRVLLQNLARLEETGQEAPDRRPAPLKHLEAIIGLVPHMCTVLTALICGDGQPRLYESGLWKLALETLLYLIEDSMATLEQCNNLDSQLIKTYWSAIMAALARTIVTVTSAGSTAGSNAGNTASVKEPEAQAAAGATDTLIQAVGNLITHRLLACKVAPREVSRTAVQLLGELAGVQRDTAGGLRDTGGRQPASERALGHLFDLCARTGHEATVSQEGPAHSVAAMSAWNGGAPPGPPPLADRAELLATTLPSLLSRVRAVLTAYSEEDARAAPTGLQVAPQRIQEVRFALARLKTLRVDPAEFAATVGPQLTGKAISACELAGPQACAMALLPQLGALASTSDAQVRREVRQVLERLSAELGLAGL